jgi:hypothetical protein
MARTLRTSRKVPRGCSPRESGNGPASSNGHWETLAEHTRCQWAGDGGERHGEGYMSIRELEGKVGSRRKRGELSEENKKRWNE